MNDPYRVSKIKFEPGDVVIDIGGYHGEISIPIAKANLDVKVFIFEPNLDNFDKLLDNLNGTTNVIAEKLAISDGRKDVFSGFGSGETFKIAQFGSPWEEKTCYTTQAISLDDVFIDYQIPKCKFLKIDCEASEYDIFRTFTMWDRLEYVSIEIHTEWGNEEYFNKACELEKLLTEKIHPEKLTVIVS